MYTLNEGKSKIHYQILIKSSQNQMFIPIRKKPSLTSARDKAKKEYIRKGQPSTHDLAFGVELGPSPHSKRT